LVRVGIIQSNYIPWRGYFDFIDNVDLFIFHDDLQYTKGDWRNRNKLKTQNGASWITVPVKYHKTSQLILESEIDYSTNWQKAHLNKFRGSYSKAPFFKNTLELFSEGLSSGASTISQLNICLIKLICSFLHIKTPLAISSDYNITGAKTERLINLLKKVDATTYLSGPAARDYLDEDLFRKNNISLEYKTYDYKPYP
jgi:hypothetical protein